MTRGQVRTMVLAQALAMSSSDQKSTAAANSQYQTAQDAIMLDTKAKLVRDVMDHEATHAECTQTFVKKIRNCSRRSG